MSITKQRCRLLLLLFFSFQLTLGLNAQKLSVPNGKTPAKVSVIIRELSTGHDIVSQNPDLPLTPASITKCVTSAAVMTAGKEEHRFQTPVYLKGEQADSLFYGDLIIEACGDPTTESEFFPDCNGFADSIAANLSRLGITRLNGNITVDGSAFTDAGPGARWDADDLKWSYGAGLYPLNYNNNTRRGTDRSVSDPAAVFLSDLRKSLSRHGITVTPGNGLTNGENTSETVVYVNASPTMREILRSTMVRSDNLFAEGMLRSLDPSGTTESALSKEARMLEYLGVDTSGAKLYDGSGMTRANKMSASFMADLLTRMALSSKKTDYAALFPRAGQEGTVKSLLRETRLAGSVAVKSGSMKGVQCFAGYLLDDNGSPTHVIVVMVNDYRGGRTALRNAISNFLLKQLP